MNDHAVAALKKIQDAFEPGPLGATRDAMIRLQDAGDTTLFDGPVRWSVMLTDADKRMNGDADSLDQAFSDMIACLAFLSKQYGDNANVSCAIDLT